MTQVNIGVIIVICAAVSTGSANIQAKLVYFETLKVENLYHRVKRSPDSNAHLTEIKVTTLGKQFHMLLHPSKILSNGFVASVVDRNGDFVPFDINRDELLTGSLADDSSAMANVNILEDGIILANIMTKNDTYIVEPSWRHLPPSDNHSMIAYRKSDMKHEFSDNGQHKYSVCGIKEGEEDEELHGKVIVDDTKSSRTKRQSPFLAERTTCQLMVVADYTFYQNMGGSSSAATALYLINIIQFVTTMYRKTQFDQSGNSMIGVGFEIGEMRIHNAPYAGTTTLQGWKHYNAEADHWDTKDLLESFSMDDYFKRYCLAHLFTYRSFDDGVLGLAYIASDRWSAVGGICSKPYGKYAGTSMTLNTGWSSSRNSAGHRLLALQAQLVTAHELGHNMGSEHDPDNDNCAPSAYKDGKYVMYPWAVSGYDKNNLLFSPCSREFIFKVLKVKGHDCFREGRGDGAFCGNGRIDENEECDAGYQSKNNKDLCCTDNCKLHPGKLCSPMNYGCCTSQCQTASKDVVCRSALEGSCEDEIKCDGKNITCPKIIRNKNNTTPCIDQGTCYDGQCLNFCEMSDRNLTPCICHEDSGYACYRCCRQKNGGPCEKKSDTFLPDGRPCYRGLCNKGTCDKKRQDMVQRLFEIIEDINIDQLVEFMKTNIVGTVIVFSVLIWIPGSCVVCCMDRREARRELSRREWLSRSNRTLYMEDESLRIHVLSVEIPRNSVIADQGAQPHVKWPSETRQSQQHASARPLQQEDQVQVQPMQIITKLQKSPKFHPRVSGDVGHDIGLDVGPDKETTL